MNLPLAADSLGLPFTLILGALLWLPFIAFMVPTHWWPWNRRRRRERLARLAAVREVSGPFSAIADLSEYRANRAVLAQRDRWSRSA